MNKVFVAIFGVRSIAGLVTNYIIVIDIFQELSADNPTQSFGVDSHQRLWCNFVHNRDGGGNYGHRWK